MFKTTKSYDAVVKNFKTRRDYLSDVVKDYVARLDGFSQGYNTSGTINLTSGNTVKVKTRFLTTLTQRNTILPSSGGSAGIYILTNAKIYCRNDNNENIGMISIDGGDFAVNPIIPLDGLEHEITVMLSGSVESDYVGYDGKSSRYYCSAALYDLEVLNSLNETILLLPLTNKDQGANQLATVGNINTTMANFSTDVWEVV